jgi:hypothetical protein
LGDVRKVVFETMILVFNGKILLDVKVCKAEQAVGDFRLSL